MLVEYGAIENLQSYVDSMPKAALEGARIALNDVATGEGLAIFRDAVAEEANFPPGYLNNDRLGITQRATIGDLAVTVTGRFRATSLARFAQGAVLGGKAGVQVTVKRGQSRTIKRGFLIKLKSGNNPDKFNLGLAIRLKPGEKLTNTSGAQTISLDKGLYLLYGPSVDQIFRSVGPDETPVVLKQVETEFFRQFFRLVDKKGR